MMLNYIRTLLFSKIITGFAGIINLQVHGMYNEVINEYGSVRFFCA